ncbi:MAG: DpnI domain-containing protein [Verrucomicrobiota bacterium]
MWLKAKAREGRASGRERVHNLLLVPSFAFPPSAIIKRKPLSSTARRAGWIGCNIALNRVPAEARIAVVTTILSPPQSSAGVSPALPSNSSEGRRDACATLSRSESVVITSPAEVRAQFRRVKPLSEISVTQRGWTLDVLNTVRRLVDSRRRGNETRAGKSEMDPSLLTSAPTGEFTTADVYAFERELEKLHPDNRHVKDKIRQQLQVLRDLGFLLHVERGVWRLP